MHQEPRSSCDSLYRNIRFLQWSGTRPAVSPRHTYPDSFCPLLFLLHLHQVTMTSPQITPRTPFHKHAKAMVEVNKISTKLRIIRSFTLISPALLFSIATYEKLLLGIFLFYLCFKQDFTYCWFVSYMPFRLHFTPGNFYLYICFSTTTHYKR